MIGYIYTLSSNGNIFYVGKTCNPVIRKQGHKKLLKNKSGQFEIIDEVEIRAKFDDLAFFEKYWIDQIRQWGFNLDNKGGNLSSDRRIFKSNNRNCLKCGKGFSSHDKYIIINGGKEHRICSDPESYPLPNAVKKPRSNYGKPMEYFFKKK